MSAVIIQIVENLAYNYVEVVVDGKSCGPIHLDDDVETNIAEELHDIIKNVLIRLGIENIELEMK